MLRIAAILFIVVSISFMVGCGSGKPTTYEVTGTVVFKDGKPLTHGSVEFETLLNDKPITAVGQIASDGTFKLGTYTADDGALPGKHRVAVFASNEIGTKHERPDKLPPAVLDPRFSDFEKSKLSFTVDDDANNFRIEVERVPAK